MKKFFSIQINNIKKDRAKIFYVLSFSIALFFLIVLPQLKIFSLHTTYYDLGIFQNVNYRVFRENDLFGLNAGHLFGFYPIYKLVSYFFPHSIEINIFVLLQSFCLIFPAFIFLRKYGIYFSFIYLLNPFVWSNNLFDFHFDHLAIPILALFYLSLINRNIFLAIVSSLMLMFVKEIFALQTIACGLLMFISSFLNKQIWFEELNKSFNNRLRLGSLFVCILGSFYFIFVTHFVIPFFNYIDNQGFNGGSAFGWLGSNLSEIINTVLMKPGYLFSEIFSNSNKLIYLFVLFGSLAFIPLLAPIYLIPIIPLISIALLSGIPNYYDYFTHYTAGLIIPLLFSFIYGFPRACKIFNEINKLFSFIITKSELKKIYFNYSYKINIPNILQNFKLNGVNFYLFILIWVIVGNFLLSPSPISRLFLSDKLWSFSFSAYYSSERDEVIKAALLKYIPINSNISISTQNTLNWEHLASRKIYLAFPDGVNFPKMIIDRSNRSWTNFWNYLISGVKSESIIFSRYADYVVLDLRRPYYLLDKGCDWIYGACSDKVLEENFLFLISNTKENYISLYDEDGLLILKRNQNLID